MSQLSDDKLMQRIDDVRDKYRGLIHRQPGLMGIGSGILLDSNGDATGPLGIIIWTRKLIDQNSLPPEDRIPGCLDGIPVQFAEGQWRRQLASKAEITNATKEHRPVMAGTEVFPGRT